MITKISKRLFEIIEALPIDEGMRILEIGCGPGVAARAIVNRWDRVYVLAVDRSLTAVEQAEKNSAAEIQSGKLRFVHSAIEAFELPEDEALFDLAFAVRVGALDGRHPEIEKEASSRISASLKKGGRLFIDGGNPLKEIKLGT